MEEKYLSVAEDKFIKITYGALMTVLIGIVGFAVWMALMQSRAEANTAAILRLDTVYEETKKTLISIDNRLQRIEIMLEASSQKRGE